MKEENLDLGKYEKLKRYLRERNVGFQPKKSSVFTRNELNTFFIQAPDHKYLGAKAAAGMAISGACRRVEIKNMKVADVVDNGDFLTITVKETKTHVNRTFTINNPLRETILDYMSLRPTDTAHDYLFVNYQNGKCTRQAMGINKIGKIPEEIASWLNLDNPETYTGHSFRRTSATWLIDGGGSLEDLKRHGTWKSSTVAEGYIADSIQRKRKMNDTITNGLFDDGTLCVDPLATKIKRRITAYRETRSQPSSSTSSSSQSSRSSTNKPTTSISWSDSSNRRLQESNSKRGPSVNISLNDCCLQ
ncbi:hypothetical protein QAD02_015719 [Eretmocerus hayati]|uniref:Uncharacterized protein n=1 Tax=Eretmocerus hayati TaxID=131215 RepID=A0ACC2PBX1_9HYME|nr:hypothetical protein QAD02_015719 [Eretmocerus hayati]